MGRGAGARQPGGVSRASRRGDVVRVNHQGSRRYADAAFRSGDALLLGPESRGLPGEVLDALPAESKLIVPMVSGSRSLNLSNAAAVVVYEAWRQLGFAGAA
ncbi:tRNA (cytidine(34)-2'-O)-methyltransferase [Methylogaea oryzae]|uniref:tRNA (cytidine(34)-2'-O)-methyltransferase n=1 Tax=Methylogaea oryzae TaxID=1295382 RepID=UPI00402B87F2